jgi:hypothetical protein
VNGCFGAKKEPGAVFLEKVYNNALLIALRQKNCKCKKSGFLKLYLEAM